MNFGGEFLYSVCPTFEFVCAAGDNKCNQQLLSLALLARMRMLAFTALLQMRTFHSVHPTHHRQYCFSKRHQGRESFMTNANVLYHQREHCPEAPGPSAPA